MNILDRRSRLDAVNDRILDHKCEAIVKASAISGFLAAQHIFLASDLQITTNLSTTLSNILSNLSHIYCDSLCWLLFGIQVLILIFSKNEKAIEFAKRSLVVCIILFIVFKFIGAS